MEIIDVFLKNLHYVAREPLAFFAYISVVAVWGLKIWLTLHPKSEVKNILKQYTSDSQRTKALGKLLGSDPPSNLPENNIIEWTELKIKEKTKFILLVGYISTLITFVTIFGITYQKTVEEPANLEIIELEEVL